MLALKRILIIVVTCLVLVGISLAIFSKVKPKPQEPRVPPIDQTMTGGIVSPNGGPTPPLPPPGLAQ
jgi:hypothetical protein